MEYITKFPNSLIYVGLDGVIVTVPGTAVLNDMEESQQIGGYLVDPKDAGAPDVLVKGDTFAVTTDGGQITGTYVGSATINNAAASTTILGIGLTVQVNPIPGHVIQSGSDFYFISAQEFSEERLQASVMLALPTGQIPLANVPVSELADRIRVASLGVLNGSALNDFLQGVMDSTSLTLALNAGGSKTLTNPGLLCFCAGTLIMTARGPVPVEQLEAGDMLLTFGGEFEPVLWIGHQVFTPAKGAGGDRQRPVRISAGALARGCPERDLFVSQQHRILLGSELTWSLFDVGEVLVAAGKLVGLPGITLDQRPGEVHYYHLLLQEHHALLADGAWCESLFSGPEALRALPLSAREFIADLYSRLHSPEHQPVPAFPILTGAAVRRLVQRHLRHRDIALTRIPMAEPDNSRTAPARRDLPPDPGMAAEQARLDERAWA